MLLLCFACTLGLLPSLTRLAASFDNTSSAYTLAVAKLDLQYGAPTVVTWFLSRV